MTSQYLQIDPASFATLDKNRTNTAVWFTEEEIRVGLAKLMSAGKEGASSDLELAEKMLTADTTGLYKYCDAQAEAISRQLYQAMVIRGENSESSVGRKYRDVSLKALIRLVASARMSTHNSARDWMEQELKAKNIKSILRREAWKFYKSSEGTAEIIAIVSAVLGLATDKKQLDRILTTYWSSPLTSMSLVKCAGGLVPLLTWSALHGWKGHLQCARVDDAWNHGCWLKERAEEILYQVGSIPELGKEELSFEDEDDEPVMKKPNPKQTEPAATPASVVDAGDIAPYYTRHGITARALEGKSADKQAIRLAVELGVQVHADSKNADPDDLVVGAFDGRDRFICFHARVNQNYSASAATSSQFRLYGEITNIKLESQNLCGGLQAGTCRTYGCKKRHDPKIVICSRKQLTEDSRNALEAQQRGAAQRYEESEQGRKRNAEERSPPPKGSKKGRGKGGKPPKQPKKGRGNERRWEQGDGGWWAEDRRDAWERPDEHRPENRYEERRPEDRRSVDGRRNRTPKRRATEEIDRPRHSGNGGNGRRR